MDKREYLSRLEMQLSDLTNEERLEALEYYEEYFADAGEENEEEVILSLGAPEQVAEQIKAGLHKEEKGMFTENGYREKLESDNPPEVYGKKAERQSKGPHIWGRKKQKDNGYHAEEHNTGEYNRAEYDAEGGKAGGYNTSGNAGSGYHSDRYAGGRYNAGGYQNGGQNEYGYGGAYTGRKKEGMSGGTIALIVVLCIFASPFILSLAGALLGVMLGVLGTVLGVIAVLFAVVITLFVAGITMFIGGFPLLFYSPFAGMVCIAIGCVLIALFLVCAVLLGMIFSKFFPWLIREVESFGKYLSRKWSERKGRGEAV